MNLHPQFIGQEGADEYVVLPIKGLRLAAAALEYYQDQQDFRRAREADGSAVLTSLADVMAGLDVGNGERTTKTVTAG